VLVDQSNEQRYIPLNNLAAKQGEMRVRMMSMQCSSTKRYLSQHGLFAVDVFAFC